MTDTERQYCKDFLKRWYNDDMTRLIRIAESIDGKGWDYYKDNKEDVVVAIPARFSGGYACFFGDMAYFNKMLTLPSFAKRVALTHR